MTSKFLHESGGYSKIGSELDTAVNEVFDNFIEKHKPLTIEDCTALFYIMQSCSMIRIVRLQAEIYCNMRRQREVENETHIN